MSDDRSDTLSFRPIPLISPFSSTRRKVAGAAGEDLGREPLNSALEFVYASISRVYSVCCSYGFYLRRSRWQFPQCLHHPNSERRVSCSSSFALSKMQSSNRFLRQHSAAQLSILKRPVSFLCRADFASLFCCRATDGVACGRALLRVRFRYSLCRQFRFRCCAHRSFFHRPGGEDCSRCHLSTGNCRRAYFFSDRSFHSKRSVRAAAVPPQFSSR